jgi:hypothetical protein
MNITLVSSLDIARHDILRSTYLLRLEKDPSALPERILKYSSQSLEESPQSILFRHLYVFDPFTIRSWTPVLRSTYRHLQDTEGIHFPPSTLSLHINVVEIRSCPSIPNLENNASFTIGSTIFLSQPLVQPHRKLAHEFIHILQRLFPSSFHDYYLNTYPRIEVVTKEEVRRRFFGSENEEEPRLVDNPDCSITDSIQYALPSLSEDDDGDEDSGKEQGEKRWLTFYDQDFQKSNVELSGSTVRSAESSSGSGRLHHPHELLAYKIEKII